MCKSENVDLIQFGRYVLSIIKLVSINENPVL